MPLMPVSYTACSPASTIPASISARHFPMISSIRPGGMRPPARRRPSALAPAKRSLSRLGGGERGALRGARARRGFLGPGRAPPLGGGLPGAPRRGGVGCGARHFLLDLVLAPLDVAPPPPYLSIPR